MRNETGFGLEAHKSRQWCEYIQKQQSIYMIAALGMSPKLDVDQTRE